MLRLMPGRNALPFSGRIRNKPLKPGRYQARSEC
jgi:hypothetical protein